MRNSRMIQRKFRTRFAVHARFLSSFIDATATADASRPD